jgi:rsbT co-antagonist protein RsbR
MPQARDSLLARILAAQERDILEQWTGEQMAAPTRQDLIPDAQLREQSREFLALLSQALQTANGHDVHVNAFDPVRRLLVDLSRRRALAGFSPTETAKFVLSLKRPIATRLTKEAGPDVDLLTREFWSVTDLLDTLALLVMEAYQKSREEVIFRQQQDMLELSTPVVKLWDGVLALPMIGTLDSARTQVVMETLLQRIVESGAEVAIIDITGVPTVDTLVAQHLIKTVTAARLMGADCIVSGIRPQIAQTIVHLGVDLTDVATKATLADAFRLALRRAGLTVVPAAKP